MSLDDRNIEEFLTKLDFKRSYPELVIGLIEKSRDLAGNLYAAYERLDLMINNRLDDIKKYLLSTDRNLEYTNPIAGVDGSMVPLQGLGEKWFVVYSVSKVIFPKGILSFSKPAIKIGVHTEFIGEKDPSAIKREAVIKMMYGESKALRLIAQSDVTNGAIFLDGPFIDPPNISDDDYIDYRIETFNYGLATKNKLIGIVKRYSSKIFSGLLAENVDRSFESFNDRFLVPLIFNKFRAQNNIKEYSSVFSKPIALRKEAEIAIRPDVFDKYRDRVSNLSYKFYGFYFQYAWGYRVVKVEFFAKNDAEASQEALWIAKLLRATVVPGLYLPLPVLLAHETSLIRKRVAKVILSNALSRFIANVSDYSFVYDLIIYE